MSEEQERARKVRPELARGELVRVTGGRNLADSELIQNILLEEGIPSVLRRTRGFDVPDFLAAGPRDVLVPESGYERAREMLTETELLTEEAPPDALPGIGTPARLAIGIAAAVAIGFVLVVLLDRATS